MDEVDGMAGNEDRGGIQVKLLQLLAMPLLRVHTIFHADLLSLACGL